MQKTSWEGKNVQLRALVCVHHGGDGNTEVRHRAPEICTSWACQSVGRQEVIARSRDNCSLPPSSGCCQPRPQRRPLAAATCFASRSLRRQHEVFPMPQVDCLVPHCTPSASECSIPQHITKCRVLGVIRRYRGDCPMTGPEEVGDKRKSLASRTC